MRKSYEHLISSYLVKLPKRLRQDLPIPDSFLVYASLGVVLSIVPHEPSERSNQTKLLVETRHGQEVWTTNHWLVPLSDLTLQQQNRLLKIWNNSARLPRI